MEVYDKIPLRSSANKNLALDVNQLMSNLQAQYLAPSTTLTLTKNNSRRIVLNPSADVDVVMPSTDITVEDDFQFYNISYKVVTFKSSALEVLGYLHNGGVAAALPKQSAPTLKAHWGRYINNKTKRYMLSYNGGVGTLQDNGTYAIATPSAPLFSDITVIITLWVDPDNKWWANYTHATEFNPVAASPNITINGGFSFVAYVSGTDIYLFTGASDAGWAGISSNITCYGTVGNTITSISGPLGSKPTWAD